MLAHANDHNPFTNRRFGYLALGSGSFVFYQNKLICLIDVVVLGADHSRMKASRRARTVRTHAQQAIDHH